MFPRLGVVGIDRVAQLLHVASGNSNENVASSVELGSPIESQKMCIPSSPSRYSGVRR
jgi:hypothetical protein